MKMTYDPDVDCGYIYFADRGPKSVAHTVECKVAPENIFGQLNVDIGHDGRVVGIEILGVRAIMPKGFENLMTDNGPVAQRRAGPS